MGPIMEVVELRFPLGQTIRCIMCSLPPPRMLAYDVTVRLLICEAPLVYSARHVKRADTWLSINLT